MFRSNLFFNLVQCETHPQVGALTAHEIYMKTCIDVLTSSDCPNPYMCITNCASDGEVDPTATKIIPFNNYGEYYLRIRICEHVVHKQEYSRCASLNTLIVQGQAFICRRNRTYIFSN